MVVGLVLGCFFGLAFKTVAFYIFLGLKCI